MLQMSPLSYATNKSRLSNIFVIFYERLDGKFWNMYQNIQHRFILRLVCFEGLKRVQQILPALVASLNPREYCLPEGSPPCQRRKLKLIKNNP